MEKQTFEIPKGCSKVTVEQIGNTIVTSFESEKYLPKVGDCVKRITPNKSIIIGVICDNDNNFGLSIKDHETIHQNWLNFGGGIMEQITPEELQAEFNRLGYEYNFETHEATKIKWKPKEGELYYCVSTECKVIKVKNDNCYGDIEIIKIGNCYRTPEEAEKRRQHYLAFKY